MINYIEEVIYHDDDVSSSQIILKIQRKQKSSVIVFRKLIKCLLMLTYNNNGLYIVMSVLKKENQGWVRLNYFTKYWDILYCYNKTTSTVQEQKCQWHRKHSL